VLSTKSALKWGLVTGVTIGSFFLIWVASVGIHLSHQAAWDQIYLGMPRDEVLRTLQRHSISCGLAESGEFTVTRCTFADLRHFYLIALDPKTNTVSLKRVGLRGGWPRR
jgi:hypothetical protein